MKFSASWKYARDSGGRSGTQNNAAIGDKPQSTSQDKSLAKRKMDLQVWNETRILDLVKVKDLKNSRSKPNK